MNKFVSIGILGTGACLPEGRRYNNDKVYEEIISRNVSNGEQKDAEPVNFKGFNARRCFEKGESLEALTENACNMAIDNAGINAQQIDRLYGYLSVSPYLAPNALFDLHARLNMRVDCGVIPINSEYTNFLMGLLSAKESIAAGHVNYALVACGQDWTRHMDYRQEHAFSIGDGTGAAVVGKDAALKIVAHRIETISQRYGAMTMATRKHDNKAKCDSNIYYDITTNMGMKSLIDDGVYRPVHFIKEFIDQYGVAESEIDLICYQASGVLLDYWKQKLYPMAVHDTLAEFGNMSLSTLAVNLHYLANQFDRQYVLLFSLGIGFHQMLILLKRG